MRALIVLLLAYSSFLALCLAMPRHHAQVFGFQPSPWRGRGFRFAGWLLLTLSFFAAVTDSGWQIGPVEWFGFLSAAGLVLVAMLPYVPRLAAAFGVLGTAVALAYLVWQIA